MAFFKSLICFIALFGTLALAFQPRRFVRASPNQASPDQQAQISQSNNEFNPVDNSFAYGYQASNGIASAAKGYADQNGAQVIEGSYSYTAQDGSPISISYRADANGYQAVGDAIPQGDAVIQKAVAYLRSLPPSAEDEKA